MFILIYILTILFLFASQGTSYAIDDVSLDSAYEDIIMPDLFASSVVVDTNDRPPTEPVIVKVNFKKIPILTSLDERVDRLVHGVAEDIPPEFDHYGYEIRRYMAHIGNVEIFKDKEYLVEQIRNVKKAQVIFEYWERHLEQEIKDMTIIINDNMDVSPVIRTSFKQNVTTVRTFLISIKLWIGANDSLLMFVYNNYDNFDLEYPEIYLSDTQVILEFYNLITARQTRLKDIVPYRTYAMMVF